jgi:hypothetical protein
VGCDEHRRDVLVRETSHVGTLTRPSRRCQVPRTNRPYAAAQADGHPAGTFRRVSGHPVRRPPSP